MIDTERIALSGVPGSPYTRKMLALLRYRRIPYRFLISGSEAVRDLPRPKVELLPTFYLPNVNGQLEAIVDSSPIARRLEGKWAGRGVIPTDPALAFLDALVEDYADEWLTKALFHYRWRYPADIDRAARILPLWQNGLMRDEALEKASKALAARQIDRLSVVGSNSVTGPVIEASYRRFLLVFEAHLTQQAFIFGARPATCDFALFGQLTQLASFDPTPMALTLETAPRVFAWVGMMEDLSGLEPAEHDWITSATIPKTLAALLAEIGRVYAPVMQANAHASAANTKKVEAIVDGQVWSQTHFHYQAKCLQLLRDDHAALAPAAKERVDRILIGTGCEALFDTSYRLEPTKKTSNEL